MHEKTFSLRPCGLLKIPFFVLFDFLPAARVDNFGRTPNTGKLGGARIRQRTDATDHPHECPPLSSGFLEHELQLLWASDQQLTDVDEIGKTRNEFVGNAS